MRTGPNLVYTFTRTGSTTGALTVNFSIGGTADSSTDYTQTGAATFVPPSGTVTFGAGNSTAQVTVDPSADATTEADETVILTVVAGTGYEVGAPDSATGTINNDDNAVSVAVSPLTTTRTGDQPRLHLHPWRFQRRAHRQLLDRRDGHLRRLHPDGRGDLLRPPAR